MLTAVFYDVSKGIGAEVVVRFTDGHPTDVPSGSTVIPILFGVVTFQMLHRADITINLKQHNRVLRYKSGDAPNMIRNHLAGISSGQYKIIGHILLEESNFSAKCIVAPCTDKGITATGVPAGKIVIPIIMGTVTFRMLHRANFTMDIIHHTTDLKQTSQSSRESTVSQCADKESAGGEGVKDEKENGGVCGLVARLFFRGLYIVRKAVLL